LFSQPGGSPGDDERFPCLLSQLCRTIKYLRGAAGIGLGTTAKYLRRTTSAAVGNGLSTTIK
jgi:hypothetical protein